MAVGHLRVVRSTLPPVVCAPWCCDGAGHVGQIFRADQNCRTRPVVVAAGPDEEVGVYVRKPAGGQVAVLLDIEAEGREVGLAAAQAREVARALFAAAEFVDDASAVHGHGPAGDGV